MKAKHFLIYVTNIIKKFMLISGVISVYFLELGGVIIEIVRSIC